jgi:hypothetical protein
MKNRNEGKLISQEEGKAFLPLYCIIASLLVYFLLGPAQDNM